MCVMDVTEKFVINAGHSSYFDKSVTTKWSIDWNGWHNLNNWNSLYIYFSYLLVILPTLKTKAAACMTHTQLWTSSINGNIKIWTHLWADHMWRIVSVCAYMYCFIGGMRKGHDLDITMKTQNILKQQLWWSCFIKLLSLSPQMVLKQVLSLSPGNL